MRIRILIVLLLGLVICFSCSKSNETPKETLVLGKIKKAAKLSSVEFVITKIIRKDKSNLFGEKKFLARSEATVKAGIDLSKLNPDNVEYRKGVLHLLLPPVEVTNFSYPAEKFELDTIYSTTSGLKKIKVSEVDDYFRQAEIVIRNQINSLQVHDIVEARTKTLVENIVKSVGIKEVHVMFDTTRNDLILKTTLEK